jgi:hypothetical protein
LLLLLRRWNGKDVAVKVIEHSGTTAEAVQQEMSMMMSFQHPNIVRWAGVCCEAVHIVAAGCAEKQLCSSNAWKNGFLGFLVVITLF